MTYVSEVRTASVIRAGRTSETSVLFNVAAPCFIPEDSKLHTRRRENLKSHIDFTVFVQPSCFVLFTTCKSEDIQLISHPMIYSSCVFHHPLPATKLNVTRGHSLAYAGSRINSCRIVFPYFAVCDIVIGQHYGIKT
jgi:hypothetical protein